MTTLTPATPTHLPHLSFSSPLPPSISPSHSPPASLSPTSSTSSAGARTPEATTSPSNSAILLLAILLPPSLSTTNDPDLTCFIEAGMLSGCLSSISIPTSTSTPTSAAPIVATAESIITACPATSKDGSGVLLQTRATAEDRKCDVVVLPLTLPPNEAVQEEEAGQQKTVSEFIDALRKQLDEFCPRSSDAGLEIDILLVDDLIHPTAVNSTSSSSDMYQDPITSLPIGSRSVNPGLILLAKILGAAAELGYPLRAVRRLGELVAQNLGSVYCSRGAGLGGQDQDGDLGVLPPKEGVKKWSSPEEEGVRRTLARLLKSEVGMRVNSNEPVLLLNTLGRYTRTEVEALLAQTITQLHADYSVRPVRIYIHARDYPAGMDGSERGFNVTILNVVNSELGGPSMVQLLDFIVPSKSAGWGVKVGKEEWEEQGWEVARVVGLGMRSWIGHEIDEDEGSGATTGRENDGSVVEHGECVDREVQNDVLGAEKVQDVTIDAPADFEESEVLDEQQNKCEDPLEVEIAEGREETQDQSPRLISSTTGEADAQVNKKDDKEIAEESVFETKREEAPSPRVAQEKENIGPDSTAETPDPSASAEEGFEMVDRERSLIDMVFGRGK